MIKNNAHEIEGRGRRTIARKLRAWFPGAVYHIMHTVAILGNGLDICYPAEHNKLMKCIEEKGLLISEYPPGTHPDRYRFPRRNRLISSWSDKLFVIQAEKGSGALITAEYSRKYGREVEME